MAACTTFGRRHFLALDVGLPRGVPHVFANPGDEEVRTLAVFNSTTLAKMFAEHYSPPQLHH